MAYDFKELKQKIEDTGTWLTEEYFGIRTGRATPALLDSVRVEAYGSKMPLNQVATISVEDARLLRVTMPRPPDLAEGAFAEGSCSQDSG